MTDQIEHGGERRYYLVGQAIGLDRGIDAWKFVNEEVSLPGRTPYRVEDWGSRAMPSGYKDNIKYIGLPRLRETPRFILGAGKKTTIDVYVTTYLTIVSDRLKRLMEAVDADAFEFARVEATHGKTDEPELGPYWAYGVVRMLNCVDEERFDIEYYTRDLYPEMPADHPPHYSGLNAARMIPEVVGDAAAFKLQRGRADFVIFDDRIVDAYRAEKMKGFSFSPLQEPVGRERKQPWSIWIMNHNYWHDKGVI